MTFTDFVNGTSANATDVNNALGKIVLMSGILGTTTPRDSNSFVDAFAADTAATKTNFTYDTVINGYIVEAGDAGVLETATMDTDSMEGNNPLVSIGFLKWDYYKYTIYDECDDSSVDTTLWDFTAATGDAVGPSEDATKLTYGTNNAASADAWIDTKSTERWSSNRRFFFKLGDFNTTSSASSIRLYDGSTYVTILSGIHSAINGIYEVYVDWTHKNLVYSRNDGSVTLVDISALSTSYGFNFRCKRNASSGETTLSVYYFRESNFSETTTVTESFSCDDGDTYTEGVGGYIPIALANRGLIMQGKLTTTPETSEGVVVKGVRFQGYPLGD